MTILGDRTTGEDITAKTKYWGQGVVDLMEETPEVCLHKAKATRRHRERQLDFN